MLIIYNAPPGGHVMYLTNDGMAASQSAQEPSLLRNPGKDYATIGILFGSPLAMIGRLGLPYNDMKGFIAYAKANPGKINFAVASGTSGDFLTQRLVKAVGVDVTIVGYKGGAETATSTLGGHTDLFFSTTSMKPSVDSRKLVALSTSGATRWKPFASAPTFKESGVPIVYNVTFPLMAAAETPKENLLKLNRAFHASIKNAEIAAHLEKLGYEPMTHLSPDESNAFIKSEIEAWIPILRKAKAN